MQHQRRHKFEQYYDPHRRQIFIKHKNFTQQELIAFRQHIQNTEWKNLKSFQMQQCEMCNHGLSVLLNEFTMQSLLHLYLTKCNITSLGVKVLISIEMPNLDSLVLEINKIGDQGIKWLNKGNWRLRYLNLAQNYITVEGIRELHKGKWKQLTQFQHATFKQKHVKRIQLLAAYKFYDMNYGLLTDYMISNHTEPNESLIWRQMMLEVSGKQFDL